MWLLKCSTCVGDISKSVTYRLKWPAEWGCTAVVPVSLCQCEDGVFLLWKPWWQVPNGWKVILHTTGNLYELVMIFCRKITRLSANMPDNGSSDFSKYVTMNQKKNTISFWKESQQNKVYAIVQHISNRISFLIMESREFLCYTMWNMATNFEHHRSLARRPRHKRPR